MQEFLENYSIIEIILFFVLAAAAMKGVISFFDWGYSRLKSVFDREHNKEERQKEIDKKFRDRDEEIQKVKESQSELTATLNDLNKKIDMLIDSDKDDIKSYLTREHHYYCYVQKWIDDYSLDCCERRFKHYQAEKGNSFIEGFMNELRALPKMPPSNIAVNNTSRDHFSNTTQIDTNASN